MTVHDTKLELAARTGQQDGIQRARLEKHEATYRYDDITLANTG